MSKIIDKSYKAKINFAK